jgi:hypothetical protein
MGATQNVTVSNAADLNVIRKTMSTNPTGYTPLCAQIRAVYDKVSQQANALRASGKKALLVIASDGASSDGDVAAALRPFRSLPVWVVIRLCTDDDNVVSYWNGIDEELELDMDVLDDLTGEAGEVTSENPWLTYGMPLHRLREWGTTAKEFDLLDERGFNSAETKAFLSLIFGKSMPHPDADYDAFEAAIDETQDKLSTVYDPLSKKHKTWVNTRRLRNSLGKGGCVIM